VRTLSEHASQWSKPTGWLIAPIRIRNQTPSRRTRPRLILAQTARAPGPHGRTEQKPQSSMRIRSCRQCLSGGAQHRTIGAIEIDTWQRKMATDWGSRINLSNESKLYDHSPTIWLCWPLFTGWASTGGLRYVAHMLATVV